MTDPAAIAAEPTASPDGPAAVGEGSLGGLPAGFDLTVLSPAVRDGPWALQLAVRYDKAALPSHRAVCAAAARAVVTLLADERARGEWAPYLRRWRDGRIRKLVRRARGARWDRCQALPGVTVEQDGAAVRAFVPLPARPLPPALDELQVSGTVFPRERSGTVRPDGHQTPPARTAAAVSPAAIAPLRTVPSPKAVALPATVLPHDPVVTVALRPGLDLTTGKAAAQCGHAAQLAWEHLVLAGDSDLLRAWRDDDWRVRVLDEVTPADWAVLEQAPIRVIDAGFTEVDGPTETTRAWW